MSKTYSKGLYKFSGLFYRIHRFFYRRARNAEWSQLPESERTKEKWYADNKERILRYQYDLSKESLVLDVGGYQGDFAAEIYARYRCKVIVFEPVRRYVDYLIKRFERNQDIKILAKGLGDKNATLKIHVMDEASSYNRSATIHKEGKEETIVIADVKEVFVEYALQRVDLIKINIEGAEYDLLDCLIESGLISKCVNIQVQFHDFYPDFKARYTRIVTALKKTHRQTYNYPFVWEGWERIVK